MGLGDGAVDERAHALVLHGALAVAELTKRRLEQLKLQRSALRVPTAPTRS